MKIKQFKDSLKDGHNLELEQMLKDNKEELFSLRFQVSTGHLEDTSRIKAIKRNIARIKTMLRARELGLEKSPAGTKG